MQQESFGQGTGRPLPSPSYRPVANPAGPQFLASSYGGPPSEPTPPPGGGYGEGGYGQGGATPPPPPGGYDPNLGGGYAGGPTATPPPAGWGSAPGYPPPAMPQWSDAGQPMANTSGPGSYAGWWIRVLATIIDGLIVGIVTEIFRAAVGATGGFLIGLVISFLYATLLIGGPRGQTLGLMVVGTQVVDANTRQRISYGRAAVRWVVWEILIVVFFIPWLVSIFWPLWDSRNQTLHDKAASTVVIKIR